METKIRRHKPCHSEVRGTTEFLDAVTQEFNDHIKAEQLFRALIEIGRDDAAKAGS